MRKIKGNLFVVSAPSGAGKTTLCQLLSEKMPGIRHSVSYTTRKKRPGEVADRDYTFVSEAEFMRMQRAGKFAEWAKVHGNLYGTSEKRLGEMLGKGIDVILDIDVQGARKLRLLYKDAVYIFVLPPSWRALRERLHGRMSDSEAEIAKRLDRAVKEIKEYKKYDYVIVNRVFDEALTELRSIVAAKRLGRERLDPSWVMKNFLLRRR